MKLSGMKKLFLLISLLLSFDTFGQITVTGRIIDKQDKIELPGITILEKGTKNGTVSNMDGYFNLKVADKNSVLEISFVGYKPQDIQISDTTFLLIELKQDCLIDFFDYNDIGFGISSGVMNSPIGGYGYLNFILLKLLALHGEIDFQTDLSQNQKLDLHFGTLHLFADCGYDGDFDLNYRSIDNRDFFLNSYIVEGKINFSRPKILGQNSTLFLGYGLSDLSKSTKNYNSGILFGFGKSIYKPINLNVNIKTIYWQDYWEYIGEITWRYKGFVVSADYNVIDTYREINLRFGYTINY